MTNSFKKRILVTGGSGFIGTHVVEELVKNHPDYLVVNYDLLTYAGHEENNEEWSNFPNYQFVQADIRDVEALQNTFSKFQITDVIHLAAESHVDRSIENPLDFVTTNVIGTVNLLNVSKQTWGENAQRADHLFYHVSTDEVYGALGDEGFFTEETPYDPRSPYSASKASSDHFVRAYHHTYGLPIVISNCSNNYGPKQHPEKLIPVTIQKIMQNAPIPVYGKGENIRDWLWVKDHAKAIVTLFHQADSGETFNIGGNNEWKNLQLVELLCELMDEKLNRPVGESKGLITFVTDRKGHDFRYAIDASKLAQKVNFVPTRDFKKMLSETIEFYLP
jgi:dTDP-glucose 4,6-dehydratase